MAETLAIETKQLNRFFDDVHAVKSVDLSVQRGSLYGFLGPNGAGKSTTIKMLTGILVPSSGTISLLGKNPWDRNDAIEIKRQTGVVPENLALFDNLTAREYLTFTGRMYSMDISTIRARSEELLSLLKLEEVEKKQVGKKGKGQLNMRDIDVEKVKEYAAEDADITFQLKEIFEPENIK